jgi:hypothetical protein
MSLPSDERKGKAEAQPRGSRDLAEQQRTEQGRKESTLGEKHSISQKKPYQPVEKSGSLFAEQDLPGSQDDQVGGNIIGALLHTPAAEETFRQYFPGTGIEAQLTGKGRPHQGDFTSGRDRFAPHGREDRAVGPAGTALNAILQFIFQTFESIHKRQLLVVGR